MQRSEDKNAKQFWIQMLRRCAWTQIAKIHAFLKYKDFWIQIAKVHWIQIQKDFRIQNAKICSGYKSKEDVQAAIKQKTHKFEV
jgi:hypothetical protein